jgi:hypothetical protein
LYNFIYSNEKLIMLARDNNNNIIIVRHLMNLLDDNFITIKETELIFPTYNLLSKRIFLLVAKH